MWSLEFIEVPDSPPPPSSRHAVPHPDKTDDGGAGVLPHGAEFRQLEPPDSGAAGADGALLEQLREQLAPGGKACCVSESTVEGFELVEGGEVGGAAALAAAPAWRSAGRLRRGFHWQRQLVFCSKLTMHTAFERKDNADPAAVTALAISK